MVIVSMADNQSIDLAGIDAEQLSIVEERGRRVAEIEHDVTLFVAALRFDEQRQAPLVVDGAAIVGFARRSLYLDALHLPGTKEQVVGAIDHDADRHAVHHWSLDRCRGCDLNTAKAAGCGRSRECGRGFQEITPFKFGHSALHCIERDKFPTPHARIRLRQAQHTGSEWGVEGLKMEVRRSKRMSAKGGRLNRSTQHLT